MKCPVCNIDLKMSDRQGVEIDYCPQCRGVWLDRGELDKIIERAAAAMGQPTGWHSDDEHYHGSPQRPEQQGVRRKKKGFLGDFFDFD